MVEDVDAEEDEEGDEETYPHLPSYSRPDGAEPSHQRDLLHWPSAAAQLLLLAVGWARARVEAGEAARELPHVSREEAGVVSGEGRVAAGGVVAAQTCRFPDDRTAARTRVAARGTRSTARVDVQAGAGPAAAGDGGRASR